MAIRVMQAILSVGCTKRARRTGHGETDASPRRGAGFAAHLRRRPDGGGGGGGGGAVGAVRLVGRVQLRQHSHPPFAFVVALPILTLTIFLLAPSNSKTHAT